MNNHLKMDLDFISNEFRVLLEILEADNDESIRNKQSELFANIDWELFIQLSMHHRVYPLIYSKLKRIDKEWIPSQIIQTLSHEYKKNTLQMLKLSGEMGELGELFNKNEIYLLFLKGPVIADDLYENISLRTSKDLDILIQKEDLRKAEHLLLSFGYERVIAPSAPQEWKWTYHHEIYYNPYKKIQLEIHWRLHPRPSKEPSFDELWQRKRKSKLLAYPVYFLGKEDLFYYLIAHGARHGWFRLRWLTDIDQIVKKFINNEENNMLQSKYQFHHLGRQAKLLSGQALFLASQLLNTPLNEDMKKIATRSRSRKLAKMAVFYMSEMTNTSLSYTKLDKTTLHKGYLSSLHLNIKKYLLVTHYLFSLKSNLQKFFFIIRLFFPNSADTSTIILPKPFRFLYFPLRPFLWIWRKTKKSV